MIFSWTQFNGPLSGSGGIPISEFRKAKFQIPPPTLAPIVSWVCMKACRTYDSEEGPVIIHCKKSELFVAKGKPQPFIKLSPPGISNCFESKCLWFEKCDFSWDLRLWYFSISQLVYEDDHKQYFCMKFTFLVQFKALLLGTASGFAKNYILRDFPY